MDELKFIFKPLDSILVSAAGCNCTVIYVPNEPYIADSLIVIVKPPPE